MLRRLKRKIRYKILRMIVRTRKSSVKKIFDGVEKIDETQRLTIAIIRKLISLPEADILLLPVGGIDNATKICFVVYEEIIIKVLPTNRIQLINGKYFYDVYFPTPHYDEIKICIFQKMMLRRNAIERRITEKTQRSLKNILSELEQSHP
jgi:hypothetical protein